MKFNVSVELEHVSGPTQNEDIMLDAFAAAIGRQNTARNPLRLTVEDFSSSLDEREPSVYEVKLIDDV